MKAIKLFAAVALVTLSAAISSPVSAQENGNKDENGKVVRGPYLTNKFVDNTFVGVAGGVNVPLQGNHKPVVTPALDVYFGKWFTPSVGARLGYSGVTGAIWSNESSKLGNELGAVNYMYKHQYGFAYVHADVLWNISNTIAGYKETRLWNFIPYANFGFLLTYGGEGSEKFFDNEFALGVGLLNSIRLHERVNLTIDLRSMFANGRFHGSVGIGAPTNLAANLSATVGVAVNLFKTNWVRAENWHNPEDTDKIVAAESAAAALTAANQALEADKAKLAKQNEELNAEVVELRNKPTKAALEDVGPASVYFEIGQTTLSQKELQHLDFYLKNVLPNVGDKKVAVITGSADSKTGTVRRNKYLSQKRVDYVMNILAEKYGIEADRFQVRTQVANEGEAALNRAVIISFE
jgi:outer membrane protein OmpA-like peptidoglycan-associated protein